MRLVDHVVDRKHLIRFAFELDDLEQDSEDAVGIDRSDREIVVRVMTVVEVKATQHPLVQQERHDVFDVLAEKVMPGVDQNLRPRPRRTGERGGHAPVRDVGVVEGGLERLVLHEHPHRRRHRVVHLPQRRFEPAFSPSEVPLPRVVRSVREPEREHVASDRPPELNRPQQVLDRPAANRGVLVRDRAQPVALILKEVRIDGTDPEPSGGGHLRRVAGLVSLEVPLDVDRDARAAPRHPVDLRGIVELVLERERRGILQILAETSAGVREAPAGEFDAESIEAGEHVVEVGHGNGLQARDRTRPTHLARYHRIRWLQRPAPTTRTPTIQPIRAMWPCLRS